MALIHHQAIWSAIRVLIAAIQIIGLGMDEMGIALIDGHRRHTTARLRGCKQAEARVRLVVECVP